MKKIQIKNITLEEGKILRRGGRRRRRRRQRKGDIEEEEKKKWRTVGRKR